jgi:tRNA(fMet)-specific endonuclease VapC
MIVLDTSAASAVMHGVKDALERLRREHPEDVVLVAPVAAEIRFGLERLPRGSRRRRLLEAEYARLREVLRWEDWTQEAADEFGRQKARLSKLGTLIEDFDIAIGSAALALGARLATLNTKHMARLEGLGIDDWSPESLDR